VSEENITSIKVEYKAEIIDESARVLAESEWTYIDGDIVVEERRVRQLMVYIIIIVAVALITIGTIITIVLIRRRQQKKVANMKISQDADSGEHDLVKVSP